MSDRVIIGKNGKQWQIPEGVEGTPISEIMPIDSLPDNLKNALVYEIGGQKIITRQDMLDD